MTACVNNIWVTNTTTCVIENSDCIYDLKSSTVTPACEEGRKCHDFNCALLEIKEICEEKRLESCSCNPYDDRVPTKGKVFSISKSILS